VVSTIAGAVARKELRRHQVTEYAGSEHFGLRALSSYTGLCEWLSKPLDEDHYWGHQVIEGNCVMLASDHNNEETVQPSVKFRIV